MGFDLGALIRGTAGGITGFEQGKREAVEAERKARLQLIQERLLNAQVGNYESQAQSRLQPKDDWEYDAARGVQIEKRTGAVRQPQGLPPKPTTPKSPVTALINGILYQHSEENGGWEPVEGAGGTAIPQTPKEQGNQIVVGPDGKVYRVPVAGPAGQVEGVVGKGTGGAGGSTIKRAVAKNRTQVSVIDEALRGLRQHPGAVGLKNYLPDPIIQRVDPEGVDTRAAVADIGSLKIHDRSGGAVSVSEFPRLAPFIPSAKDTPDAARKKLTRLRQLILEETAALEQGGPDDSADPPPYLQRPTGGKKYRPNNPFAKGGS